ncbi:uncharacterized protein LOC116174149 [Photinus pyralis]|uniref:uncharacterized protein LOC116164357 n=1 Tax=Photinus pyralis TaxID=7054 RepID=UPI0012673C49|nr:uncharacterized protein LOC116164357 [Photinus pyralis]XP_031347831.1 uncharacterized protein LOC116174149 [Photinus pyralis]
MSPIDSRLRQVRTKTGGGTRKISVDQNSKCQEVLTRAIDLFFPLGKSSKGPLTIFEVELLDYKSNKFDTDLTVKEMYDISALSILRFYLATIYKEGVETRGKGNDEDDVIPSTITSKEDQDQADIAESGSTIENTNCSITSAPRRSARLMNTSTPNDRKLESGLVEFLTNFDGSNIDSDVIYTTDYTYASSIDDLRHEDLFPQLDFDVTTNHSNNEEPKSNDTTILVIHRGKVLEELIEAFQQTFFNIDDVKITMILPNGQTERAEDIGGVFRDSLSEFWESFYDKCTRRAVARRG